MIKVALVFSIVSDCHLTTKDKVNPNGKTRLLIIFPLKKRFVALYFLQCADSSDDDEDDVLTALAEERFKVTSLEKMINIIAMLVESSRVFRSLQLSDKDMDLLVGGKVCLKYLQVLCAYSAC